jgi:HEAT repeat protein
MDPREAKAIMSQGAIRPETPRDREERRILEEELATSPVKGAPLRQRLRNFRPDGDSASRALGGPTLWMRRLRAIEEEVELHEQQLGEAWRELAQETSDADAFARRWREVAAGWSFAQVNELIERHNRNFPAEARLPMDPRTRDFVKINGRPYQRDFLDEEWVLERFPPDLRAARRGA